MGPHNLPSARSLQVPVSQMPSTPLYQATMLSKVAQPSV